MSENKPSKEGEMIPIRDARGNFLTLGGEVVWTGCRNLNHLIGKVTGWDPGGISLIETGPKNERQTPARVRMTFEVIVAIAPGLPFLAEYFRIINPAQETLIDKVLTKSDIQ